MEMLQERLDLRNAHAFQEQLVRLMQTHEPCCEIDASQIEKITTPSLQLLLACKRALAMTGTELKIVNPSDAIRDAARQLGLASLLET